MQEREEMQAVKRGERAPRGKRGERETNMPLRTHLLPAPPPPSLQVALHLRGGAACGAQLSGPEPRSRAARGRVAPPDTLRRIPAHFQRRGARPSARSDPRSHGTPGPARPGSGARARVRAAARVASPAPRSPAELRGRCHVLRAAASVADARAATRRASRGPGPSRRIPHPASHTPRPRPRVPARAGRPRPSPEEGQPPRAAGPDMLRAASTRPPRPPAPARPRTARAHGLRVVHIPGRVTLVGRPVGRVELRRRVVLRSGAEGGAVGARSRTRGAGKRAASPPSPRPPSPRSASPPLR